VKLSREQARDVRSGRAWATRVAALPVSSGPSAAATYTVLAKHLAELRAVLAANGPHSRPIDDIRRSHEDLDRALARAIAHAFAADARGAPTPDGIVSWASEGLARSYERELAMFAAMDLIGLAQPLIKFAAPVTSQA